MGLGRPAAHSRRLFTSSSGGGRGAGRSVGGGRLPWGTDKVPPRGNHDSVASVARPWRTPPSGQNAPLRDSRLSGSLSFALSFALTAAGPRAPGPLGTLLWEPDQKKKGLDGVGMLWKVLLPVWSSREAGGASPRGLPVPTHAASCHRLAGLAAKRTDSFRRAGLCSNCAPRRKCKPPTTQARPSTELLGGVWGDTQVWGSEQCPLQKVCPRPSAQTLRSDLIWTKGVCRPYDVREGYGREIIPDYPRGPKPQDKHPNKRNTEMTEEEEAT